MKGASTLVICTAAAWLGTAAANDAPRHNYPTQARVEYVFDCMNELGGENYDTLYKCSCSIDYIAERIPYNTFVTLDTYSRGKNAAGERPEVLREGKLAENSRARLTQLKDKADDRCLIDRDTTK